MGSLFFLAVGVGAVMGFIGSMPIAGPVAVLVLERGLVRKAREGLGVALGAAAAETIYAFLAFWGVGAVLRRSPAVLPVARLVSSAVLITIGIYLATRKSARPELTEAEAKRGQKRKGFLLGASVTLLNPTIIATWTVAVAAVHSSGILTAGLPEAIGFALGVGGGIVGWFATLLHLLNRFQRGMRPENVDRVLHIAGWVVVGIGIALGVRPLAQALGWLKS
jgi:threonine/homoserine/homoserine lactone efflux protein